MEGKEDELLKQFWDFESIGLDTPTGTPESLYTKDEQEAVDALIRSIKYDPIRFEYSVKLCWKLDPAIHLDSNARSTFAICRKNYLRAVKDGRLADCNGAYQEMLDNGFSEIIPKKDLNPSHPIFYLPSMPVYKPDRLTTKVRIVMDASNKCSSTKKSINDCLFMGPCLLPDIVHVLLRFQIPRYVAIMDISKMFMRIRIQHPEHDMLRFVWRFAEALEPTIMRMLCVTFGLNCSPFIAIWVLHYHCRKFQDELPKAAEAIIRSTYMDDVPTGKQKRADCVQLVREMVKMFELCSMKAHKWSSNDPLILDEAGVKPEDKLSNLTTDDRQKVLGIVWNKKSDTLEYNFTSILEEIPAEKETKRSLIRQVAKLYDPLGKISPFVLRAKLMFQQCWLQEVGWDDILPQNISVQWEQWKSEVPSLSNLSVPRVIYPHDTIRAFLATFVDASKDAYACVTYLVTFQAGGHSDSNNAFSKTRVAPVKWRESVVGRDETLSIARLELLAAYIGARIGQYVENDLDVSIERHVYFTDSLINLQRIKKGAGSWKVWVGNRLVDILSRSKAENWYYTPGTNNPSDMASRGTSAELMCSSEVWWKGPNFLRLPESQWPAQRALTVEEAAEMQRIDATEIQRQSTATCTLSLDSEVFTRIFTRFESWYSSIKLLAWTLRFSDNCRRNIESRYINKEKTVIRSAPLGQHSIPITRAPRLGHGQGAIPRSPFQTTYADCLKGRSAKTEPFNALHNRHNSSRMPDTHSITRPLAYSITRPCMRSSSNLAAPRSRPDYEELAFLPTTRAQSRAQADLKGQSQPPSVSAPAPPSRGRAAPRAKGNRKLENARRRDAECSPPPLSTAENIKTPLANISPPLQRSLKRPNAQTTLSADEIRRAEVICFRYAQRMHFEPERAALLKGIDVAKDSKLLQFSPYIDEDDLLRSRSRLLESDVIPVATTTPIILPKKSSIVEKFVLFQHVTRLHEGPEALLYFLRRNFRIIGGRREIKRIIHLCLNWRCGMPKTVEQKMGNLPEYRTDVFTPWKSISIDYFGPLFCLHDNCMFIPCPHRDETANKAKLKELNKTRINANKPPLIYGDGDSVTRNRSLQEQSEKLYGCIFVCSSSRAVHLEIANDLSTNQFLLAFKRFTARRGQPTFVRTDNATNFRGASAELNKLYSLLDWDTIEGRTRPDRITWHFGSAEAPWRNSGVERLIKSVKTALKPVLGRTKVTKTHLHTLLVEIEGILNDRPLVASSEDERDAPAITPSLLCGGRLLKNLPFDRYPATEISSLEKKVIFRNQLVTKFWNKWLHSYLNSLQVLPKWRAKDSRVISTDQIVIIREDNTPKGKWKLARIIEVFRDNDGLVRRVTLRNSKGREISRPTNKIAILEGVADNISSAILTFARSL